MAESFCHACFSSEKEELLSSAQFTEPEASGIHGMAIGRHRYQRRKRQGQPKPGTHPSSTRYLVLPALYVLIAVPQFLFRPRRFCHFARVDVKSGRRLCDKNI
jgi:hypothetical protein